ncbi:LytR C-terminal domain-containing protein [Gordonia otitidis]|nr:LytR C-terminal domain-containing protein [Gordonia otitidis]
MNADREPNRLPLRAGAMLLLAVAVVFVGLGWHSAATSGQSPDEGLRDAEASVATTSAPATSSATASAGDARLCVINAGSISGLASEVTDELKAKGFTTADPANYNGGSFTENTILYRDSSQKAEAQKVATALGSDASVEQRPTSFTMCRDGIAVVVVTR